MSRVQPVESNGTDVKTAMSKLESLNEVIISQHLMNFQVKGYKFSICDVDNNQFMQALEQPDDSSSCWRMCCSRIRPLSMIICDNEDRTVMELNRPYRCRCSLLWCCCLQLMAMKSPLGIMLGEAKQEVKITPTFAVKDATSKMVCRFVYDNSGGFKILKDDCELGCIQNISSVFKEENKSGITNVFKVTFEKEMNVMMKALIIASSFLVDFNYMDNSMLQIKTKINDMHTQEVVFQNCEYKQIDHFAGGRYKMRINPLF